MIGFVLIIALLWLITLVLGVAAAVARAVRLATHGIELGRRIVAHAVDPESANVCAVESRRALGDDGPDRRERRWAVLPLGLGMTPAIIRERVVTIAS